MVAACADLSLLASLLALGVEIAAGVAGCPSSLEAAVVGRWRVPLAHDGVVAGTAGAAVGPFAGAAQDLKCPSTHHHLASALAGGGGVAGCPASLEAAVVELFELGPVRWRVPLAHTGIVAAFVVAGVVVGGDGAFAGQSSLPSSPHCMMLPSLHLVIGSQRLRHQSGCV